MENKNTDEKIIKDLIGTDEEIISEETENNVETEKIIEEKADELITLMPAEPVKFGKKQVILVAVACLAVCVTAIFLLPSNSDKKQAESEKSLSESQKTTTQSLMDEFAIEHNLVVTTTAKTALTSTTTEVTTTTTPFTMPKTTTTAVVVNDDELYKDLIKLSYSNANFNEYSYFTPDDMDLSEKLMKRREFDSSSPTAPVYKNQIYELYYLEYLEDGGSNSYLVPQGEGLFAPEQMKEIVEKTIQQLGAEIISIGFMDGSYSSKYYDSPPEGDVNYRYGALCKGVSITLSKMGELEVAYRNYRMPSGYTLNYTTTLEERYKTLNYFKEEFSEFLDMEEPVVNDTTENGKYYSNPGIYDAADTKYEDSYVEFINSNGVLTMRRNLEPKASFLADYPILSLEEAKAKLKTGEYYYGGGIADKPYENSNGEIVGYSCAYATRINSEYKIPYYVFYVDANGMNIFGNQYENIDQEAIDYFDRTFRFALIVPAIKDKYTEFLSEDPLNPRPYGLI